MRTLLILAVFYVLSLGFTPVSYVHACSGGGTDNIQRLLARTDYVVKADVISVDDVRQNAVLSVDSYLFGGSGAKYLVFVQLDPIIVTREIEGELYGNCDFFQKELNPGVTAYFFLARRADGVYVSTTQWNDPNYYSFPDPDTTITLYSQETDGYLKHVLTENDFVTFVSAYGETTPAKPDTSTLFPRLAPLKITTVEGTDYVLPVDSATPVKVTEAFLNEMTIGVMGYDSTGWNERYFSKSTCPGDGCVQVSPDGINRAEQKGEEIHWLGGSATGQAFLFSSTGDAIAIWNENRITFYTLGWRKRDQPFSEIILLNSVTLTGDADKLPYQAAWSPDGRSFSYSDLEGLWSLDVYDPQAEPTRLLTAENTEIPVARMYSPRGRYLQIEQGNTRYTLDTISGDIFPDGFVSPDDQLLLAFDTQADEFEPEICYFAPVRACTTFNPHSQRISPDESRVFTRYKQAQWRNHHSFIVTVCEAEAPDDCIVTRIYSAARGGYWASDGTFWHEGYTFDYFPPNDTLAVVQDAFTVQINDEELDFSSIIDGKIVEVKWLPSLFYAASYSG